MLSISRDITEEWRATSELKEAAGRQTLLTRELEHRIKNTLAMVGAIANQTMQGDSVSAAREALGRPNATNAVSTSSVSDYRSQCSLQSIA